MKNSKPSFAQFVASLPALKELKDDTKLPYVFDASYDCKTFGDLKFWKKHTNPEVKRLLREHGFNVTW